MDSLHPVATLIDEGEYTRARVALHGYVGEGISRSKEAAIAYALRDLAEKLIIHARR